MYFPTKGEFKIVINLSENLHFLHNQIIYHIFFRKIRQDNKKEVFD